jgi:excisionase family DNA binding protein
MLKERTPNGGIHELMTVAEVATLFRVDDTTVRRWIRIGALEAVYLPRIGPRQSYRIKGETVAKLLQSAPI